MRVPILPLAGALLACLAFIAGARAEEEKTEQEAPRPTRKGLVFVSTSNEGVETWLRPRDGATVLRVPGGSFVQRPYEADDTSLPTNKVDVPSFFLDRTEVTNAQFVRFLNDLAGDPDVERAEQQLRFLIRRNPADLIRRTGAVPPWRPRLGRETFPVVDATGFGALAYATWLGGRLPSQAEWEKAAGGPEGRIYPWGDEAPDATRANFARPSLIGLAPVGDRPAGAGPYGHMDMAGNAYERVMMKRGAGEATPTMLKGGSWLTPHPLNLRVLDMCVQPMQVADGSVGFRVAMDDPEPERPTSEIKERPTLRVASDFGLAIEEAEERGVPIFLSLHYDTCGQCDRIRAQLFREPRFIAYCNEHLVVVVGHHPGDAGRDCHKPGPDGRCPFYPSLECWQHHRLFTRGLRIVGEFRVSPGNFVLDPNQLHRRRDAAQRAAGQDPLFLAREHELPKWGGGVQEYLGVFERARRAMAARLKAAEAFRQRQENKPGQPADEGKADAKGEGKKAK